MRVAVAGEESFQPQHVRVIGRPDDHRSGDAALEETDTSEDESAHDALADLCLGDQHLGQPARGDDERLDGLRGTRVHERGPPSQLRELSHEGARGMSDDGLVPVEEVVLRDSDLSRQDNDEAEGDLTGGRQSLGGAVRALLAEAVEPSDLRRFERREHLIVAGLDDRP